MNSVNSEPELPRTLHFELPGGIEGPAGRAGRGAVVLRAPTAADREIVKRDPRVRDDPSRLPRALLARLILRLGELEGEEITLETIEELPTGVYQRLQEELARLLRE